MRSSEYYKEGAVHADLGCKAPMRPRPKGAWLVCAFWPSTALTCPSISADMGEGDVLATCVTAIMALDVRHLVLRL